MSDLSHRNPYVFGELLKLARWLIEEIGFDGFRYDFVKGYGALTVTAMQEYRYLRDGRPFQPYGVAEHWSAAWPSRRGWSGRISRTRIRSTPSISPCASSSRRSATGTATACAISRRPTRCWGITRETAVTFVENHDLRDSDRPIVNDKLLAYSYILTHEGYPCVFWKDWFRDGLGREGTPNGIAALVQAHERYAGGGTRILWLDDDFYVMERTGYGGQPGLVYALNNRGDHWNGARVTTAWRRTNFRPVAWWSPIDQGRPADQVTGAEGRAQFWAPPRGFVVYAPDA